MLLCGCCFCAVSIFKQCADLACMAPGASQGAEALQQDTCCCVTAARLRRDNSSRVTFAPGAVRSDQRPVCAQPHKANPGKQTLVPPTSHKRHGAHARQQGTPEQTMVTKAETIY